MRHKTSKFKSNYGMEIIKIAACIVITGILCFYDCCKKKNIIETKKPEKSRQKAAGCRNTQEVIYTQPLFITPFYLLKGYRSDRLDINIPVIPKAARRDGFTR